jgi:hypothetical protein
MPDDDPQETLESLTEALRGLYEVVGQQAHLIASLIRALDDAGIDIPGVRTPMPPSH